MSLFITGDIMVGRGVGPAISNKGFSNLLKAFRNHIGEGPIISNLECPLTNISSDKKGINGAPKFNADPDIVKDFKINNFIGFSLANNHIFDSGLGGYNETILNLQKNGIFSFGSGLNINEAYKAASVKIDQTRVSFIGISYRPLAGINKAGVADAYNPILLEKIKEAKNNADVVIVMPHTGIEFLDYPIPRDQSLFRSIIDAGADLVVGGHPHCVQVKENYNNSWIYYSIGDLIFDHADDKVWSNFRNKDSNAYIYSPETKRDKPLYSITLKLTFKNNKIANIEDILVKIPKNIKVPFALPLSDRSKDDWIKEFNKRNLKFKEDKNLQLSLEKIEKDLITKMLKR
jgi:poly-gamma-glutamate capsule biosynthesis protein CapA/YwtB (metallophosphatase superfamily)